MKKLIIILLIIGLVLPLFSLAQNLPENLEDFRGIGKRIWEGFISGIKNAWQSALEIWQKMWEWFKNFWNSYIFPFFQSIWQRILDFFQSNVLEKFKRIMQPAK